MFRLFKKKEAPLLQVSINGKEVCCVLRSDIPCEKTPSSYIESGGSVEFIDSRGESHIHGLGDFKGWFHFSVRVHSNLACQADCAITNSETFDSAAFARDGGSGIRFQPFFISGGETTNDSLRGKGLFARGLHFSGNVTPGNVLLSCECDYCRKAFLIRSYHAGFSNSGYFYSGSGKYTITVSDRVPGSPAALSVPDPAELAELEASLPKAPDGSEFRYLNPFRCPHCSKPYIDFEAHPDGRPSEYYGNYFLGSELLRYEPNQC